ncbi:MAG: DNA-3-methyladenine glycosylase I [Christensenellales bacterium]|jgi:DNA-3-methyladenine glycosylase I
MNRCSWAKENDPLIIEYHDAEYGQKKDCDNDLFEKLCLECFQAGLSWRIVLAKRDALRQCFYDFDPVKISKMTEKDVERMMSDSRIIRNRHKIEAVIHNAKAHQLLFVKQGSFSRWVYSCKSGEELSINLKKKGYRFLGPTICSSFLMSVGAIEGHEKSCFLYKGEE